ncbi:cytochrome c, class I [Nitrobacter hamburgensis X14]|uniref:Cytochrome c, class I n=1 Tax=Nitrobacter hamburgensis (strain DSM 10229 / NCIMB 13809 / X14) TaxID=323097 RepID=Q1QP27_NITHX|nr:cytochrome c [Nitrobacter hamburgensis]ABE62020.1 cytochrome c, class I [Nitrobacter hamburgensis X14]
MRLRSIVIGAVIALVFIALGGIAWTWRSAIAPISAGGAAINDHQIISRGADLAAIGGCGTCHTADAGKPLAGGLPLPTPFGTIFSTNITPDAETGIGTWSEAAFQRSMREGVDREGRHLYPAFPYDHFTRATDDDIRAVYAFLMSQPAIRNVAPSDDLVFPLNFRPLVAGWKVLFLDRGPLQPDASKSAEWNRGQYLADGLGHCGACHTPRNDLGAEKKDSVFAGGSAEGWDAPALDAAAAPKWTANQLTEYLATGWHPSHGAAAGPMADVVNNLKHASAADVRAIAIYIASFSSQSESVTAPARENRIPTASAETVALYNGSCAQCHREANDVGPSKALPLSRSSSLRRAAPTNTVRVVLSGIQAYRGAGGPYMPAFDGMLSDQQIAAVVDYARARHTNQPPWVGIQDEITKARQGVAQ